MENWRNPLGSTIGTGEIVPFKTISYVLHGFILCSIKVWWTACLYADFNKLITITHHSLCAVYSFLSTTAWRPRRQSNRWWRSRISNYCCRSWRRKSRGLFSWETWDDHHYLRRYDRIQRNLPENCRSKVRTIIGQGSSITVSRGQKHRK